MASGNQAIAARLVVTDGAVHEHIRSIFNKLDLPPDHESDRRVVSVLSHLRATGVGRGGKALP
ncbi:hypothetical protein [Luteococcus japonicus]|uniref:hypothetical protein n=1 Tax=Luteococcus japonicus TaxID=33984 RepID=UPI001FEB8406|nr:hypothetical protein [Luteococcus japonicus]